MNNEEDESTNNVLIRFGVNCGQKRENGEDFDADPAKMMPTMPVTIAAIIMYVPL